MRAAVVISMLQSSTIAVDGFQQHHGIESTARTRSRLPGSRTGNRATRAPGRPAGPRHGDLPWTSAFRITPVRRECPISAHSNARPAKAGGPTCGPGAIRPIASDPHPRGSEGDGGAAADHPPVQWCGPRRRKAAPRSRIASGAMAQGGNPAVAAAGLLLRGRVERSGSRGPRH
jgi:hypothetical protein